MHWIAIFLLSTYLIAVDSQQWIGNFTVDSGCNMNQCCCLTNTIAISTTPSNQIAFNASLSGVCFGQTGYYGTADNPNGFTMTAGNAMASFTITLSSDSNTLSISSSLQPTCIMGAVRASSATTAAPTTAPQSVTTTHGNSVRNRIDIVLFFNWILVVIIMYL